MTRTTQPRLLAARRGKAAKAGAPSFRGVCAHHGKWQARIKVRGAKRTRVAEANPMSVCGGAALCAPRFPLRDA